MRRGRKSSWEGEQWESEGGKNRDKTIVMVKLIIQKKPQNRFSLLSKGSRLILLVSNPGIGAWYSGLCGERC
jgi:hypothetical protein